MVVCSKAGFQRSSNFNYFPPNQAGLLPPRVTKAPPSRVSYAPEWLTPHLFCGMAYLGIGNRTKAKEMLTEFESRTGPAYDVDACHQISVYLHRALQSGENPTAQGIRSVVKDQVDQFLNAWLSINAKKRMPSAHCHRDVLATTKIKSRQRATRANVNHRPEICYGGYLTLKLF
jgi:hypothetical protein